MLSSLNDIKFALAYSKRFENILQDKALLYEQKTYQFFFDPMEASNLLYHLQMQERCSEDDCKVVKQIVLLIGKKENGDFSPSI
jgi:hypothetical protein